MSVARAESVIFPVDSNIHLLSVLTLSLFMLVLFVRAEAFLCIGANTLSTSSSGLLNHDRNLATSSSCVKLQMRLNKVPPR